MNKIKVYRQAKKKGNITYNEEKNQSTETKQELAWMLELADKNNNYFQFSKVLHSFFFNYLSFDTDLVIFATANANANFQII